MCINVVKRYTLKKIFLKSVSERQIYSACDLGPVNVSQSIYGKYIPIYEFLKKSFQHLAVFNINILQ